MPEISQGYHNLPELFARTYIFQTRISGVHRKFSREQTINEKLVYMFAMRHPERPLHFTSVSCVLQQLAASFIERLKVKYFGCDSWGGYF